MRAEGKSLRDIAPALDGVACRPRAAGNGRQDRSPISSSGGEGFARATTPARNVVVCKVLFCHLVVQARKRRGPNEKEGFDP
jgi:hypothetical protein